MAIVRLSLWVVRHPSVRIKFERTEYRTFSRKPQMSPWEWFPRSAHIKVYYSSKDGANTKCGSQRKRFKAFHIQTILGFCIGGKKKKKILNNDLRLKGIGSGGRLASLDSLQYNRLTNSITFFFFFLQPNRKWIRSEKRKIIIMLPFYKCIFSFTQFPYWCLLVRANMYIYTVCMKCSIRNGMRLKRAACTLRFEDSELCRLVQICKSASHSTKTSSMLFPVL